MNRRPSEWLDIVKEYYNSNIGITRLAQKRNCDPAKLKYLIRLYELHGDVPFTDNQESRIYTREEKLKAIEEYLSGTKSGRQIALELGSPNPDVVRDWRHIYEEKGEAGIHISRGRKKYLLHEERQAYLADKELRARNEHLELENEYLKKSLALAFKKNKRLRKKYESLMNSRADLN